jgi:hypothetical protein
LIAVYGAAQENEKEVFLSELVRMCGTESEPLLLGGDFNIIRGPDEKNNNRFNERWPSLFNAIINNLFLRELELSGRQFTWANNLSIPTYEKLDKILVSTEWEFNFSRVTVRSLPRVVSDHMPLLLDTGSPSQPNKRSFKFELAWLFKDGFHENMAEVWQRENKGSTTLEKWQNKIRTLRRYLRGWVKNINEIYKKEKKDISGHKALFKCRLIQLLRGGGNQMVPKVKNKQPSPRRQ